jgi:predicted glycoside hydrolase/deacetylase ChbG (UPF0249 family)
MLIINADDWGRSVAETDTALQCFLENRVTSVSAMVFMADSERAAKLAKQHNLDVGLHLNFAEAFSGNRHSARLDECQNKIVHFLRRSRFSQLLYNPFLQKQFLISYQAQIKEFERLFERSPSHVDGHHHLHLCLNFTAAKMIPPGMKIRGHPSFWPGEKGLLNRAYRRLSDRWLAQKYRLIDYFFDLSQCLSEGRIGQVASLAKEADVELMTHPVIASELGFLLSEEFLACMQNLRISTHALR